MRPAIIYEDNHLLAVQKPAGLPTMGVASGQDSLIVQAKQYVQEKYNKPGNVYLGTVSRLDAPVTGVVLFARTSKAAARLAEQFREGTVEKVYLAIVAGRPRPENGTLVDWLVKHERHRKVEITNETALGAKHSALAYRTIDAADGESLLEIKLITGRKHQIRVQLANLGHPIRGDRKYGSRQPFAEGIALHARRLVVQHPVKGERIEFVAPLPKYWKKYSLGQFDG